MNLTTTHPLWCQLLEIRIGCEQEARKSVTFGSDSCQNHVPAEIEQVGEKHRIILLAPWDIMLNAG